jgi:hypothetical protein
MAQGSQVTKICFKKQVFIFGVLIYLFFKCRFV